MLLDEFGRPAEPLPVAKPAGFIVIDGVTVADTLQCVHCQAHWVPMKGSGIVRGFCMNCMGPVCGKKCATCTPIKKRIEQAEKRGRW